MNNSLKPLASKRCCAGLVDLRGDHRERPNRNEPRVHLQRAARVLPRGDLEAVVVVLLDQQADDAHRTRVADGPLDDVRVGDALEVLEVAFVEVLGVLGEGHDPRVLLEYRKRYQVVAEVDLLHRVVRLLRNRVDVRATHIFQCTGRRSDGFGRRIECVVVRDEHELLRCRRAVTGRESTAVCAGMGCVECVGSVEGELEGCGQREDDERQPKLDLHSEPAASLRHPHVPAAEQHACGAGRRVARTLTAFHELILNKQNSSIILADWSAHRVGSGFPFQQTSTERCVEVACPRAAHTQHPQEQVPGSTALAVLLL